MIVKATEFKTRVGKYLEIAYYNNKKCKGRSKTNTY